MSRRFTTIKDAGGNKYIFNKHKDQFVYRINELAEKIYANQDISWEYAVDKAFYAYVNHKYIEDMVNDYLDNGTYGNLCRKTSGCTESLHGSAEWNRMCLEGR